MSRRTVIVDGYNVLHGDPGFRERLGLGLDRGRDALLRHCTTWLARRRDVQSFCLVFDGSSDVHGGNTRAASGVRLVFTESKEEADDRILDLLRESARPDLVTVVSDDRYVSEKARALGADIMSVAAFTDVLREDRRRVAPRSGGSGVKTGLSAAEMKAINDDLKREWGLD